MLDVHSGIGLPVSIVNQVLHDKNVDRVQYFRSAILAQDLNHLHINKYGLEHVALTYSLLAESHLAGILQGNAQGVTLAVQLLALFAHHIDEL